ncbi:hypothetical protein [Nostocoides sp. HKS02]|uniref:hypothetical protein n=1 Tax=Nostocoides sp. HKS02 TaxID=1813880 RepID=UPI00351AEAAB
MRHGAERELAAPSLTTTAWVTSARTWPARHTPGNGSMDPVTEQTATSATTPLAERSTAELDAFVREQQAAYDALTRRGLSLDLTRGKPAAAQLDLSDGLFALPRGPKDAHGVDTRNYGGLEGDRRAARDVRGAAVGGA